MAAARSICARQRGSRTGTGTGNQHGRKHGGTRRQAPSTPGWLTVYLIDTNVLSEVIRPRPNLKVVRQLLTTDPALRFASDITRYELRYGAMLRSDGGMLWARIAQHILPLVRWLPVDEAVVLAAADLGATLRRAGQTIAWPDLMLAATASAHGLTVVTRNLRHFDRVPGALVENWFPPESGQAA